MKDIARRAGVSQATVSHVLRGRHGDFRISAHTAGRVLQMAAKLGYRESETEGAEGAETNGYR